MAATTLADRAVVRISGEDVRGFLQALVTNDVSTALPVWAGLLTPQGKCLFDFIVWEDGDDILLDCEKAAAEELSRRLSMYRLRRPIRIEQDSSLAVHWSPARAGVVADPRLPDLGHRWLGPASDPADGWREHRLRLGVCEGRSELGDILWLECNAVELNGVSFTKGCFVGQENTARMNWRQKVNRRLLVVPDGEAGDRTRVAYPDLGLRVDHRRTDDLESAIVPAWLARALSQPAAQE